jgi:hypothetical protein
MPVAAPAGNVSDVVKIGEAAAEFGPTADFGHKLMRHTPGARVPRKV